MTRSRPGGSPFTVMTFNVRYDEPDDGRHAWRRRRDLVIAAIRRHDPDLLGLQEPDSAQWAEMATALPDRWPFGNIPGREDVDPQGGFVRATRFARRATGRFWLSETPDVEESVSWPNDWGPRSCGWARLHDRLSGGDVLFACTHFDTNAGAWLPSARVLHTEIARVAGDLPIVLVGDFNCAAGSDAHRYLCGVAGYRDGWTESGGTDDGVVTFNAFGPIARLSDDVAELDQWLEATTGGLEQFAHYPDHVRRHGNYRIDWILLRGPVTCTSVVIDTTHEAGLMPSDHYPVVGSIEWA